MLAQDNEVTDQSNNQQDADSDDDMMGEFGRHRLDVFGDYTPENHLSDQTLSTKLYTNHYLSTGYRPPDRHDMTLSHGMDTAQQAEMAALLEKNYKSWSTGPCGAVHPVRWLPVFDWPAGTKAVKYRVSLRPSSLFSCECVRILERYGKNSHRLKSE